MQHGARFVAETIIEYGTNTTRSIASLIFSGTTSRYPDEKWVFSHAGGTMPFLIENAFSTAPPKKLSPASSPKFQLVETGVVGSNRSAKVPKGVLYELRQMYYDCAQTSNPIAMRALRTVVPVSQIVSEPIFRSAQQSTLQKVPRYVRRFQRCGNLGHQSRKRVETFGEETINMLCYRFTLVSSHGSDQRNSEGPERCGVAWR